jgi:hypothetical protein
MGVKFTQDAARRISATVRQVEGMQAIPQAGRARGPVVSLDYMLVGKTSATHTKGELGDIAIYSGTDPDDLQATGETVEAYNRFGTIQANKWVFVVTMPWGLEITAAEC